MRAGILIASLTGVLIIVGIWFAVAKKPADPIPSQNQPQSPCPDFQEGEITIGEKKLVVAIAEPHEEKIKGLSGCGQLPENSGMLFPYNPAQEVAFWMKDMVIPIDIIWIRDGKVIGLETGVPAPRSFGEVGSAPADLPQYKSPGPIDSVLEIKSGGAGEYGIDKGDLVL